MASSERSEVKPFGLASCHFSPFPRSFDSSRRLLYPCHPLSEWSTGAARKTEASFPAADCLLGKPTPPQLALDSLLSLYLLPLTSPLRAKMSSEQTHLAVGVTAPLTPLVSFSRPTPSPNSRQLLVKTLAVGFTPLSQWQVDFGLLVPEDGLVLGGNLVAEVLKVGSELAKEVKVGDKVSAIGE